MTATDRTILVDPVALTADVARLAAMNVEVLDRLALAVFAGQPFVAADVEAHVQQVLTDMTALAERLGGGSTDESTPRCSAEDWIQP